MGGLQCTAEGTSSKNLKLCESCCLGYTWCSCILDTLLWKPWFDQLQVMQHFFRTSVFGLSCSNKSVCHLMLFYAQVPSTFYTMMQHTRALFVLVNPHYPHRRPDGWRKVFLGFCVFFPCIWIRGAKKHSVEPHYVWDPHSTWRMQISKSCKKTFPQLELILTYIQKDIPQKCESWDGQNIEHKKRLLNICPSTT